MKDLGAEGQRKCLGVRGRVGTAGKRMQSFNIGTSRVEGAREDTVGRWDRGRLQEDLRAE